MSNTDTRDEWELGSGLSLDGAHVRIEDLEFGFNTQISADALCANVKFVNVDDGEEMEQSFSVGKGFDASRDGSELVSDKPKAINKNTNFGVFITSVVECLDGDGSKLGGSPKQASTWIGTEWTMGTKPILRRNPTTGAETTKDVFVATEYHGRGEGGGDGGKPAAAKKATGGTKPAAAKASGSGAPDGIDDDLWSTLVSLAGEHAEHDDFVEAALDLEQVEGNKAAQKAVMGTKAGSVWAAKGA